jgi:hypothetical protein
VNIGRAILARKLLISAPEARTMVIRFKESVRVRIWGKEMSSFRKGQILDVATAVAGVLLAQGYVEPVKESTPEEFALVS